jgi:AraC-like DNA-binding protein
MLGESELAWIRPYVRHCGMPTRPKWELGPRKLLDYLLHAVEKGEGVLTLNGIKHPLQAGDLFWIPPHVEHAIEGTSARMICPYVHFDLIYRGAASHWHFDIEGGTTDLSGFEQYRHPPIPADSPFQQFCGIIRDKRNDKIIDWMKAICVEASTSHPYSLLRSSGYMMLILGELSRMLIAPGKTSEQERHPIIDMAISYIKQHYAESVSISEISKFCKLSTSHLRSMFKEHLDCTPHDYISGYRVSAAKALLCEAEHFNITQIAQMVGYSSIHSFSRAFKDHEGMAPTEYRTFGQKGTSTEHQIQLAGKADIEDYCKRQRSYRGAKP